MKTPAALSHQNVMGLLVMKFNLIQTKPAPRPARPAPPLPAKPLELELQLVCLLRHPLWLVFQP